MPGRPPYLHLPFDRWPESDRLIWQEAMGGDDTDPFNSSAGAHLAETSRRQYWFAWRRLLGFLTLEDPAMLERSPAERLSVAVVRQFVAHLRISNTPRSV